VRESKGFAQVVTPRQDMPPSPQQYPQQQSPPQQYPQQQPQPGQYYPQQPLPQLPQPPVDLEKHPHHVKHKRHICRIMVILSFVAVIAVFAVIVVAYMSQTKTVSATIADGSIMSKLRSPSAHILCQERVARNAPVTRPLTMLTAREMRCPTHAPGSASPRSASMLGPLQCLIPTECPQLIGPSLR
jgi:hypothetical protein